MSAGGNTKMKVKLESQSFYLNPFTTKHQAMWEIPSLRSSIIPTIKPIFIKTYFALLSTRSNVPNHSYDESKCLVYWHTFLKRFALGFHSVKITCKLYHLLYFYCVIYLSKYVVLVLKHVSLF